MSRHCLILLASLLLISSFSSQSTPAELALNTVSTNEQLDNFLDKQWRGSLQSFPEYASYLGIGDDDMNSRWTDNSIEAIKQRHEQTKAELAELQSIDRSQLSDFQQTNYDLIKWQLQMEIDEFQFNTYLIPIDQSSGVQTLDDFANFLSLSTVNDYENWLSRLNSLPKLLDQTRRLMEAGIEAKIMPPADTMARVHTQLQRHVVDESEDSLFYAAFKSMPDTISASQQNALQRKARRIIGDEVIPKYREFTTFFEKVYLPACRQDVGISSLPNGKEYYQHLIGYFTTTEMTPDEIHELGKQEVARNRAEMLKIIDEVGFDGTFDEFVTFLRTDPQFYYETSEELFNAYLATSKRLDPELTKLFGKLPRAPYGLKPIPDNVAQDSTTAYYNPPSADGLRPGYYYVNLYKPESRPKYEIEVLSVHEAVPGHHLQLALQAEMGELPMFRRFLGFTVFIEGWGLYSERLGYDMGLYKDPYSKFGQLTYDMWRSVRLVVDTGLHYKGWTRQQAIDYFKANAAKSEQDIINEIDRYISWPGQALAYKIGQLKMLELQQKAKARLGEKFNIRAFHDTMLGAGSVPLNVLEANIDTWITKQI
jgi:uncharacterized protein (DUF885 family)